MNQKKDEQNEPQLINLRPVPYNMTSGANPLKLNETLDRQATQGHNILSPNNMTTTLNNMMMMTSTVTSGDINPLGPVGTLELSTI